jgi:hypothetical protein
MLSDFGSVSCKARGVYPPAICMVIKGKEFGEKEFVRI